MGREAWQPVRSLMPSWHQLRGNLSQWRLRPTSQHLRTSSGSWPCCCHSHHLFKPALSQEASSVVPALPAATVGSGGWSPTNRQVPYKAVRALQSTIRTPTERASTGCSCLQFRSYFPVSLHVLELVVLKGVFYFLLIDFFFFFPCVCPDWGVNLVTMASNL